MVCNDGEERFILLPDAIYRNGDAGLLFGGTGTPSLPDIVGEEQRKISEFGRPEAISDGIINSNFAHDTNTARYNCNIWNTFTDAQAVKACRNILIDGMRCDLANVQTTVRALCDSDFIDSMDPTASANATKALGSINPNGYFTIGEGGYKRWVFTSTQYGYSKSLLWIFYLGADVTAPDAWQVYFQNVHQQYDMSFLPVIEL